MFQKKLRQITLFTTTIVMLGLGLISSVSLGDDRNIPEYTPGIVDATDMDLTGHLLVITNRGRYYPTPDFYCGSLEMLVYEAVIIHPSGGVLTTMEVGIPAINLNEALIPKVEVWPGTRFEVVYVINCNNLGFSIDSRQLILELKNFSISFFVLKARHRWKLSATNSFDPIIAESVKQRVRNLANPTLISRMNTERLGSFSRK